MTETAATERRPLTDKQQEVFDFVVSFRQTKGYCPTVREVGAHFGWTTNGVACHLWPLKSKGWVTWEEGQARTLRPVEVPNE